MTNELKCPYCNEELTEYKEHTTFEKLYYCGTENCPKTYRVLASKVAWQLLTKLLEEKKNEKNEKGEN